MSKEMIKSMKQTLMCCAQGQMGHLESVDAKELGEVIDMIKDLEEAMYYCVIVEAMEKGEQEGQSRYYHDPYMYKDWDHGRMFYPMSINYYSESGKYNPEQGDMKHYFTENEMRYNNGTMYNDGTMYSRGRMYASGGNGGSGGGSGSSGNGNGSSGSRYFHEYEMPYDMMMRDHREGQSPMSRRRYMEAKEMKHDKNTQLQELERYMRELSEDVVEMIEDASPEEKKYLANRISSLAQKVSKLEHDD